MAVKYGIIGCGAIGQRRHIPECAANPKSKVVALCDPVKPRVRELAEQYGAEPYTDYRKMLKNADIDAVVVCGPNNLHAPMTIDAFKAGKHVLCEKPMATTRADARKMIAAAKKARRYLMIGQNQRLMPAHVKAKQVLDSGCMGKVLAFRTAFNHAGPDGWSVDGAASWFFKKQPAVMGATGDLGVHKADLMRWLLGQEFAEVSGVVTTLDKRDAKGKLIPLDDMAFITLKTKAGVVGTMTVSWIHYGTNEENYTILYCENGQIRIGTDATYGVIVDYSTGECEMYKVGEMATNVKQVASGVIDAFTESIRRKRRPQIDGGEGYRSLNVILTALEAAKQHKALKVPK